MANPDGSPEDVDREFVTLFTVFDENKSPFLKQNMETFAGNASSANQMESMPMDNNMSMNMDTGNNMSSMDSMSMGSGNMEHSSNTTDSMNMDSNMKHSINGYIFGSMPGLNMTEGEKVRWYVMGMGGEMDMHTAHWHGQTLLSNEMRVDAIEVFPATTRVLDMVPDDPGTWLYHCHVNEHIDNGMEAMFRVAPANDTTGT
jgi:FtsP/CotA-like multicopper oxidase with cupredoxin domain